MQDWTLISQILGHTPTRQFLAFVFSAGSVSRKASHKLFPGLRKTKLLDAKLITCELKGSYKYKPNITTPEGRTLKEILKIDDSPFSFSGAFSSALFAYRVGGAVYVNKGFDVRAFRKMYGRLFYIIPLNPRRLLDRYLKGHKDEAKIMEKSHVIKPLPVRIAKLPKDFDYE